MEEVGQACEQVLLLLLLGFVCQHVLPERPAEVQSLEHGVTVTCVSKLRREVTQIQCQAIFLEDYLLNQLLEKHRCQKLFFSLLADTSSSVL